MSNKIPIIGFTNSGKTTYLAGMYNFMSNGHLPLILSARDRKLRGYFNTLWNQICQGQKPLPTEHREDYLFFLSNNLEAVCDIEWIDYPGMILIPNEDNERLFNQLKRDIQQADCLLFVVDGEHFNCPNAANEQAYIKVVLENLNQDAGIREQIQTLQDLPMEGIQLPPIGIVVTKCDLIPQAYEPTVIGILRQRFAPIFNGGANRIVLPISVTLGGPIDANFRFNQQLVFVDQPISFAVLNIFINSIKDARQKITNNIRAINEELNAFWTDDDRITTSANNINQLKTLINTWSDHCNAFVARFGTDKNIYIAGQPQNLHQYYTNEFGVLTDTNNLIPANTRQRVADYGIFI